MTYPVDATGKRSGDNVPFRDSNSSLILTSDIHSEKYQSSPIINNLELYPGSRGVRSMKSIYKQVKTEPEEKLLLTSDLTTAQRRFVLLKKSTAAKRSTLKKDEDILVEKESLVSSQSPNDQSKSSAIISATEEYLLLTD